MRYIYINLNPHRFHFLDIDMDNHQCRLLSDAAWYDVESSHFHGFTDHSLGWRQLGMLFDVWLHYAGEHARLLRGIRFHPSAWAANFGIWAWTGDRHPLKEGGGLP